MESILESYPIVIFVSIVTIYTLFFDDIRVLSLSKDTDDIFFGITSACFCIFTIEIFLAAICREEYFLTFFFWLDIVSTISMLPDIGWIWDFVTGEGGTPQAGNAAQLVKTSRAGRVTRIIRIIRLIRLIRIVKLYKQAKLAEKAKEENKKKKKKKRALMMRSQLARQSMLRRRGSTVNAGASLGDALQLEVPNAGAQHESAEEKQQTGFIPKAVKNFFGGDDSSHSREKHTVDRGSPQRQHHLAIIEEDGEKDEEMKEYRSGSGMRRMQTVAGTKMLAKDAISAHNFTNSIDDTNNHKRVSFQVPIVKQNHNRDVFNGAQSELHGLKIMPVNQGTDFENMTRS